MCSTDVVWEYRNVEKQGRKADGKSGNGEQNVTDGIVTLCIQTQLCWNISFCWNLDTFCWNKMPDDGGCRSETGGTATVKVAVQ